MNNHATPEAVKRILKEQWEKACNSYLVELLNTWGLDSYYGRWNSDQVGTIYHYGDTHNLNMDDIVYIVNNDIEEEEVLEWEDYMLDASTLGLNIPSLQSWHKKCPRLNEEQLKKLKNLKKDFEDAISDYKQRF